MDTTSLHIELQFRTSRSSGAGGQHVNKVSTQVELLFDVEASAFLTDTQKARVKKNLKNRINRDGILQLRCSSSRSQHRNKQLVIQHFDELITKAVKAPPKRKKVKARQADPATRLRKKKLHSEKKAMRKKLFI
ncbi:MAG: aminoacyl-tRNA hydrolase [Saprospiraceae bacterium]|nr:aminoacyl-tRNA hydrolase [Saprospiraceae bacterium]